MPIGWRVESVQGVLWRLQHMQMASAKPSTVVNAGFIYCIGYRSPSKFASFYKIDAETGCVTASVEINERVNGDTSSFSAPVAVGHKAFFLYQPVTSRLKPKIYCVDTDSLETIFQVDVYDSLEHLYVDGTVHSFRRQVRSSVLYIDGNIYIGTGNGCICCFDAEDGCLVWALPLTDEFAIGHVAYFEDCLYVESSARDLYAIDIEKRKVQWKFDCPEESKDYLAWGNISPLVHEDTVYLYSNLHSVYAVDRYTGILRWKYSDKKDTFSCAAVMAPGRLIAVLPNGSMHGIAIDNGKKEWSTGARKGGTSFLVTQQQGFLTDGDCLYSFNFRSGKRTLLWKIPFDLSKTSDFEYMFAQTSNLVAKVLTGRRSFSGIHPPYLYRDSVIVATQVGSDFSIFRLKTG